MTEQEWQWRWWEKVKEVESLRRALREGEESLWGLEAEMRYRGIKFPKKLVYARSR
jgi:hypothetical protein